MSSINDTDDFQISSETFFTDKDGKIKMFVNIWGHVNNPGLHEVYDGIDMATLLSVVGGPRNGAKLNKESDFIDNYRMRTKRSRIS